MAEDKKISELSLREALTGNEEIPFAEDGANGKFKASLLASLGGGGEDMGNVFDFFSNAQDDVDSYGGYGIPIMNDDGFAWGVSRTATAVGIVATAVAAYDAASGKIVEATPYTDFPMVTLPAASSSAAGVMTAADKAKLDEVVSIEVVDNLTSTSTTAALSANQGKELYDMIGDIDAILTQING